MLPKTGPDRIDPALQSALQDVAMKECPGSETRVPRPVTHLEFHPQRNLPLAVADLRSLARDLAEASITDVVIGIVESGPVEGIEVVHPQLRTNSLAQIEMLDHIQVLHELRRFTQRSVNASRVTKHVLAGGGGECIRGEHLRHRSSSHEVFLDTPVTISFAL